MARLAVALGGVALAVLLAEAALHLVGPNLPGLYNLATFQRYHDEYGFFHRPGARGWIRSSEFTSYVEVNSRGLRDRETAVPKPPGRFRILVLGDSFVEGAQVALDDTLPKQLERLLGGGQGGAYPLEAINAGNAGFGTAQEVLFLEREGPTYRPDLTLLVFYIDNDAANNGIEIARAKKLDIDHRPFFEIAADGELRQLPVARAPAEPYGSIRDALRQRSLLFAVGENLLTAKVSARRYHAMRMDRDPTMYLIDPPRQWRAAWAVTEALLRRARASAAALGSELVVVAAPSQFQIYDDAWIELIGSDRRSVLARYAQDAPNRRLAAAAEQAGVRYVDLLPGLRAAAEASPTRLYFADDGHWTADGHRAAARLVAGYLYEERVIGAIEPPEPLPELARRR